MKTEISFKQSEYNYCNCCAKIGKVIEISHAYHIHSGSYDTESVDLCKKCLVKIFDNCDVDGKSASEIIFNLDDDPLKNPYNENRKDKNISKNSNYYKYGIVKTNTDFYVTCLEKPIKKEHYNNLKEESIITDLLFVTEKEAFEFINQFKNNISNSIDNITCGFRK